jgi:hypothetical protein
MTAPTLDKIALVLANPEICQFFYAICSYVFIELIFSFKDLRGFALIKDEFHRQTVIFSITTFIFNSHQINKLLPACLFYFKTPGSSEKFWIKHLYQLNGFH